MKVSAIIPVKNPSTSKMRLSSFLSSFERERLTLEMLKDIIYALSSCKLVSNIVIVSPGDEIKRADYVKNVFFVKDKGEGQIKAVRKGLRYATDVLNSEAVIVIVADAPLVKPSEICKIVKLGSMWRTVVLVPSSDGGTNIIFQHPPNIIPLRYGRNSFRKHLEEAVKRKLNVIVYSSSTTSLDVDVLEDLKQVLTLGGETFTYKFVSEVFRNKRTFS